MNKINKMNDIFYIIVTVIFGLFVIVMAWWLYKYTQKPNILEMKEEDLSDDQKMLLHKFCSEMRRSRLSNNKKNKLK